MHSKVLFLTGNPHPAWTGKNGISLCPVSSSIPSQRLREILGSHSGCPSQGSGAALLQGGDASAISGGICPLGCPQLQGAVAHPTVTSRHNWTAPVCSQRGKKGKSPQRAAGNSIPSSQTRCRAGNRDWELPWLGSPAPLDLGGHPWIWKPGNL